MRYLIKILTSLIAVFFYSLFCLYSSEYNSLGIPYIENYDSKSFNKSLQNWSIIQDDRGIMYFANNDGILEYDASEWRFIPITNYSAVRYFCKDKYGRIYVGATKEFGYLSINKSGKTNYVSLSNRLKTKDFESVWRLFCIEDDVYFFAGRTNIYKYNSNKDTLTSIYIPEGVKELRGFKIDNQIYASSLNKGLWKITNDSLTEIEGFKDYCSKNIYVIKKINGNKLILGSRTHGLYIVEDFFNEKKPKVHTYKHPINQYFKKKQIYSSIRLKNNYIAITTLRGGLVILNNDIVPILTFNEDIGLQSNTVYCTYEDREGNLWLATEEGISKIELNSAFRKFNELNGLNGSFISVEEFNNDIFIGTSSGIWKLNNDEQYLDFQNITSVSQDYIYNLDYGLIKDELNKKDWLLATTLRNILLIDKNYKVSELADLYGCYVIQQSYKDSSIVYLGHTEGIDILKVQYQINGRKPVFKHEGTIKNFKENVRSITIDPKGNLWVSTAYNGLFYIEINGDEYSFIHFNRANGLPSLNEIYAYYINEHLIATTSKGVYTLIDHDAVPENYYFVKDTLLGLNSLSDSTIIKQLYKTEDAYWFGSNRGIIKLIADETGNFKIISSPFKRYKDIDVEALMVDSKNRLWFGARSDLYLFNNNFVNNKKVLFQTYFRKIILNRDSILFEGGNIVYDTTIQFLRKRTFNYENNTIRFEFSAPFYQDESSTKYSYKLEGYEENWSNWTKENHVTFTNLNEGQYKFLVKAKNTFDEETSTIEFEFDIDPPFYRTVAAYVIYVLILIGLVFLSINIYTRKLKLEKRKLEDLILRRTREIEQQKEEIKVQSEQLLKTNAELQNLSIVAQKTNNAVVIIDKTGEFEWVNEGFEQLYGYKLDEFKKAISPNIKTASNDDRINKQIEKCFDKKVPVTYEFNTLSKESNEVYVQTSLTPILDENNEVFKLVAIDTDISKIKLAEKEILKQQEELKLKSEELEKTNKELKKLSIVARETDNAIAILDNKGNYQWINEGYTRMYGFTYEQLTKEKDRHLIGANSNLKLSDLANIWYGDKKAIIYESMVDKRNGEKAWTQTTLTPIVDEYGSISMLIAIDSDITKLKEAEEKIESQKSEIEAQRDMAIKQRDEISVQKQEIIDSIIYAKRIQNAIFPSTDKIGDIFENNFILYRPRDIVSGDFYWFYETNDFKIAAIADCTGHGVPGAFMSIIGITFLNEIISTSTDIAANEILNQLRANVITSLQQTGKDGESRDGMDISIIKYNKKENSLDYAGANNPLFVVRNKKLMEYKADKMPISIHRFADQSFTNNNIKLEKDDIIYLFTDGFADQFGGLKGKKYKIHNFKNLLVSVSDFDLSEQKKILSKSFDDWKGRLEQVDDILVLGIRF